jgi:glutamate-1-semialdehyde 2,1-aminomutase
MTSTTRSLPTLDEAIARAERRIIDNNPESRRRYRRACTVLPGGHTRQTLFYRPFPLTIGRGSGARLYDIDGHEYIDFVSDYAAGLFGHTPQPIHDAVKGALQSGISLGGLNTKEVELAELIAERIPSIKQVRFCNSGSEACLFAAQLARHVTKRSSLVVFNGCYHGGFMAYGPVDAPLSVRFPLHKATYNDIEGTRSILRNNAHDVAAVFVEPMMGSAGCIPARPEFLRMLREETSTHGSLLVFDEVLTSRLHPGGLQGLHGIRPDLTTLGKFWGGGFPFGAFGGSYAAMGCLDSRIPGALLQSGTFNNNIVTMTAGLIGARDLYTPDVCTQLNAMGDRLRHSLNELGKAHRVDLQSTGVGASQTIHWHRKPILDPRDVEPPYAATRRLFHLEMLSQGIYVAPRGAVNLSIPISEQDVTGLLGAVDRYLCEFGHLAASIPD